MRKLAINGGSPVRNAKKQWPVWPITTGQDRKNLLEVFDSGKWWYGEKVVEFEKKYAAFQNAKYGVS
jgi:dTDP-4-amino-4,6-dideoxygalactose transaminase